jgi:ribosomal protein L7/L12/streptogramin lyase/DNA-directed RNA polymerase subunit RPC12/RpoP
MGKTFDCPACGAPLDYIGVKTTQRCPYCNNSVIVPEELHPDSDIEHVHGASVDGAMAGFSTDTLERFKEMKALIKSGNKIEAIKLFREITGVGLAEAKQAVEDLESGIPVEINKFSTTVPMSSSTSFGASTGKAAALGKVAVLAQAGKKIEAIKLYRETFDVSLVEAKAAVEKIQADKFDEVAQMALGTSYIPQVKPPTAKTHLGETSVSGGAGCVGLTIGLMLLITIVPILIAMASSGGPLAGTWARINPFAFARLNMSFGSEGTGPGRFEDARYIAVDNHSGNIYVTELQGGRIQVFDSQGKFISQWNVGDTKTTIAALAADRLGNVYLVIGGEIRRYDGATGNPLGKIEYKDGNGFENLAVAVDGGLVASRDGFNDDLVRFDKNGTVVWVTQNAISSVSDEAELDTHLALDGVGNVYALGTFNNAVYKFSTTGKYLNRWGGEGDKKGQLDFPEAIAVDNQSSVYVSDGKGIQVFDPDGRYLALIPIQAAVYNMVINDKDELFMVTNSQTVLKYVIIK